MTMKTIEVAVATELQLNWRVTKCEGLNPNTDYRAPERFGLFPGWREANGFGYDIKSYTISWSHMGPIIERELICIDAGDGSYPPNRMWAAWLASRAPVNIGDEIVGPTPLIAAARCYVMSKLGDAAEVPEELV